MQITNDIKYIGVNDHQIDLFEGQYVVPNGMAYNSYAIIDEKIAVMDTVDRNFTHEWLDNLAKVSIGNNVCISQGALLLCGNHNYKKSTFDLIVGEITIEDGAWVGAQSVVCPGVKMKSHSILSVGSVASSDLDEYCIYKGIPAEKVRERSIVD